MVYVGLFVALFAFLGSLFINSPYGRFSSSAYGFELDPRFGWWLMEIMATISFIAFYIQGPHAFEPVPLIFACLYLIHYANRGWYFPVNIKVHPGSKSTFSILVVVCGFFVTSLHGYLNATWYSSVCPFLDWNWFQSPCCIIGLILYEVGFLSTIKCESIMRRLRADDSSNSCRYKIPYGYLFEYVSSPQYLSELVAFFGWAIMTWNPAGLVIFCISVANLVPRAIQSHKWYLEKFDNYPKNRKAIIPFVL